MEFVPLALACGHLVKGWARFQLDDGVEVEGVGFVGPARSLLECPEGCGWQTWVAEPPPEPERVGRVIDVRQDDSGTIIAEVMLGSDDDFFRAFFGE